MIIEPETILWGFLPMALGVAAMVASTLFALRRPSDFQSVAAAIVLTTVPLSELALYLMVRGAWPSYLPHIVIGIALLLVAVQRWLARRGPHAWHSVQPRE